MTSVSRRRDAVTSVTAAAGAPRQSVEASAVALGISMARSWGGYGMPPSVASLWLGSRRWTHIASAAWKDLRGTPRRRPVSAEEGANSESTAT